MVHNVPRILAAASAGRAVHVPVRSLDCDRFTVGEVGVLLTLIQACEGASINPECHRWLLTAKAKLEEQKRLLGD